MGARRALHGEAFVITCLGVVREDQRPEFEGWRLDVTGDRTRLRSEQPMDQAALHGALDRLAGLGLSVTEVRPVGREADAPS